jgi:hypothetical protein
MRRAAELECYGAAKRRANHAVDTVRFDRGCLQLDATAHEPRDRPEGCSSHKGRGEQEALQASSLAARGSRRSNENRAADHKWVTHELSATARHELTDDGETRASEVTRLAPMRT